ncbi:MucB/RseB C-terminal domain-containing protein [Pseudomonas cremoricolorata]|uniref:RNA polymerase sigma-H factor AlgU n=1 Tax=Pseudomonas cremoricolorata TaxID=157783 RepID=A0A089WKC6_9PSED|nr:MucB/RseB C-terminal domain-containing protein [Pseudomonas cremoricolorata]AIR89745.1 RNA polymerase sigma-H factor AlgU [Pseudomonas cremoricolorata]
MRAPALLSLLIGSCAAVPALAANSSPQANDWLHRLAQAERQQSYQGSFIYERNGSFSSHQIWHQAVDGNVRERLSQLDGEGQEILRVNGQVKCATGDLLDGAAARADTAHRILDPLKLMSWYDLKVAGQSRVAGREAVIISLIPRDQHRYGFDLDLDKRTGLPLRSLMVNEKGQLLERYQVIALDTDRPPSDSELRPRPACKPLEPAVATSTTGFVGWRSDWLPPGFELIGSSGHVRGDQDSQGSSLLYDDGLSRFSVFLEPIKDANESDIRTQLGPTAAVSRHLVTAKGAIRVTVVGEIPLGTAERVALSVRAQDAQASH